MRIGVGYDSHRLVQGRPLVLGGVTIPHGTGLAGHSDADALCHAITDAVLGAAAAGDIGRHFPDTDPRWKDADSLALLRQAVAIVARGGLRGRECRCGRRSRTQPRLAPHADAIRARLAEALGVEARRRERQGQDERGHGRNGTRRRHRRPRRGIPDRALRRASYTVPCRRLRVRFAPSPTGHLHVGNARTALFNWLLARGAGGTFILRIEDTDVERSTRASESAIHDDLRWLGLTWDEGPDVGGPHRPVPAVRAPGRSTPSTRNGCSHAARRTTASAHRRSWRRSGPPRSRRDCSRSMRARAARSTRPPRSRARRAPVSRRRSASSCRPAGRSRSSTRCAGQVTFDTGIIGDPVLVRSDGHPAYNFAVVVDDALMRVTHVIRGEDHISNTPRQLLLYEAFGYDAAGVCAPLAGARSGSQSALETPRRHLGCGVPREGVPAGSALQLSGADRVVSGSRRGSAARGGARGAIQARGCRAQRGRVRRGQARVGEPSVPEGCGPARDRVAGRAVSVSRGLRPCARRRRPRVRASRSCRSSPRPWIASSRCPSGCGCSSRSTRRRRSRGRSARRTRKRRRHAT